MIQQFKSETVTAFDEFIAALRRRKRGITRETKFVCKYLRMQQQQLQRLHPSSGTRCEQ